MRRKSALEKRRESRKKRGSVMVSELIFYYPRYRTFE